MENFITTQSKQNDKFRAQNYSMNEAIKDLASKVDSLATHSKMLETQIAQQVSHSNRNFGRFPSQTENPREHCNAITLRSGKQLVESERRGKIKEDEPQAAFEKKREKEPEEEEKKEEERGS